jgi:hypothetical protein
LQNAAIQPKNANERFVIFDRGVDMAPARNFGGIARSTTELIERKPVGFPAVFLQFGVSQQSG